MTLSFTLLLMFLVLLHTLGDFVFQTRWMANNKSKDWKALSLHVFAYFVTLMCGLIVICPPLQPAGLFIFVGLNCALHFITDAVTSRITSARYAKGDIYGFFVTVGFDQMLHIQSLILTAYVFLRL